MYSVFLVDDEHIVLDGIRSKIDWENEGFTLAGEATDGELALSMIHDIKPDILITDIKMPFMDGLELSSVLKKMQPWIRIIILSGHDEFEYAKKAISIGVEDYILKPFTHEELLASLKKVAASLDKERQQLSDFSKMQEELESQSLLRKNKFLTELVTGAEDTNVIMEKAGELNISLISRFYKIVLSDFKISEENPALLKDITSRIMAYQKNSEEAISFFVSPKRLVTLIKSNSEKDIEDESYNFCEAIEHLVSQKKGCNVISAIGKTVDHLSQITDSYKEAEKILGMTHFSSKNRIIYSGDILNSSNAVLSLQENEPLVDRLKFAGVNEIENIINEYMKTFDDNSSQFNVIASYFLVDIIVAVTKLMENLGGKINDLMPEVLQQSFVANTVENEEVFLTEVRRIFKTFLEYRDKQMPGKYGDVILKAKDYIEKNYANQNTCLANVAEEVHLSPNHFSTIFSQECGVTFIEYLTNVRIEKAKKLLVESEMKGYDIAYECGFNDPHYFSFIFKKNTGVTPREYKNSILNTADA